MKININAEEVKRALELLKPFGEPFEIRTISKGDGKSTIYSGYFTDTEKVVEVLSKHNFPDNVNTQVYFTLNSISKEIIKKDKYNKLCKGYATADENITAYKLLLIDLDPERAGGTSSSNEELTMSRQKAAAIYQTLKEYGFSEPVTALSGNGYHLLYKVNFENTPENVQLVKSFLGTLNRLYSDNMVKIDTTVYNPARICKLYGTIAAKGTPTAERPHRQAKILTVPADLSETPRGLLKGFVTEHEQPKENNTMTLPQTYSGTSNFSLSEWISKNNVPISSTVTKGNDTYYYTECPWKSFHTTEDGEKDAAIIEKSSGEKCFKCLHSHCLDRHWKDFRLFYEPTAYDKKNDGYNVSIGEQGLYTNLIPWENAEDVQKAHDEAIEAAALNVLDNKVLDYMNNFVSVKEFMVFWAELVKYAKEQGIYEEFSDFMADQKKLIADIEKQIKKDKINKSKDYNHDETGRLSIKNLAFYLEQKNVKVKYNIISHRMEIEGFKSENQEQLVENAPALMEDDLKSLSGSTQTRIASYLNVLAARNDYNPILDKINSTVWDGKTRLNDLFKLLGIDTNTDENKYNRIFLRKWLMQCVCGLHNDMKKPFSLDIVLVFKGKQGTGKTRLLEALTLDSRYFGDGVVLDVRNKDDIMQSLSKWICELGEISSTFKKDIDSLKAFISKSVDEFRVPYGKTAVQYPRMTSFCGTVNEDEFLIDRTGNRRFAVIPLQEDLYIDYDDIKNFDFLQLWAEINKCIENMVKNGKSYSEIFRLTRSEIQELERRNGVFIKPVPAQREIEDIFQMGDNYQGNYAIEWQYMTVAEFANHWNDYLKRYSVQQVGIALKALGIDTERVTINGDRKRLKKLPIRNFEKRITT